jgi:hypothetical protein
MEGGSTRVVMQPVVASGGHWRVRMNWPRHPARYFGKFVSEAEAERWIAEHRWLTKQSLECPQADQPETTEQGPHTID